MTAPQNPTFAHSKITELTIWIWIQPFTIKNLLRVEAIQPKPQEGKAFFYFFIWIKPKHVMEQEFSPKEFNYLTVVSIRGGIRKKKEESAFIMLFLKQFLPAQEVLSDW